MGDVHEPSEGSIAEQFTALAGLQRGGWRDWAGQGPESWFRHLPWSAAIPKGAFAAQVAPTAALIAFHVQDALHDSVRLTARGRNQSWAKA